MSTSQAGGITWRLRSLFTRPGARQAASLYADAVARARWPEFYTVRGVPDTPAGRFEMLAWQVMLQLAVLAGQGTNGNRLGQEIVDRMFADMDRSLRELGVGDLSVGRQMRKLGEVWQARTELAQRVLPQGGEVASPDQLAALVSFLATNARDGDRDVPVDAAGLAGDLVQILDQLRATTSEDLPVRP